jgi:hypothetical protein
MTLISDFENLDIPAWVQSAWSQPLKKGDVLFSFVNSQEGNENDWETNAVVRRADCYAYSEGYRLAGRMVADHVIQKRWDADFAVYPVIFLYRHCVELQLKGLIPTGANLVELELSEADRKLIQRSHRLDELWELFESILQKAGPGNIPMNPEEIEGLRWYTRELHEIDPKSDSSRYATARSGQPSIDNERHPALNIGLLAAGMERLTSYLFGLGVAFHEAYQVKCEMEAEARAEYMEHHDGE